MKNRFNNLASLVAVFRNQIKYLQLLGYEMVLTDFVIPAKAGIHYK